MSIDIDKRGIRKVIRTLRKDGWTLDYVDDGGEEYTYTNSEWEAIDAITAVDEAWLHVSRPDEYGWCFFVLGEAQEDDPTEVLCDYTTNLTTLDSLWGDD